MPNGFDVPLAYVLSERISALERDNGIVLTEGAKQLLIIPILEAYYLTGQFAEQGVNQSLASIFEALRDPEAETLLSTDRARAGMRSTVSVIRAFWQRFCSIPPFCAPVRR